MTPNQIKRRVARFCDAAGINQFGFNLQKRLFSPFIRAVNYHEVRREQIDSFVAQLEFYRENFVSVDLPALTDFLRSGVWPHNRPGLILSFDDGCSSHYETVAPLLEKFGFTGWFFVPVGLMKLPENNARQIAESALTPQQIVYLQQRHVVGCHTETHCRLNEKLTPQQFEIEIVDAKKHLETVVQAEVTTFCWVGGEENSYSRTAARLIGENYEFSFMTNNQPIRPHTDALQLQRTNIEADDPLWLVRFQISGLLDLMYRSKRTRVNRLTGKSEKAER